MSQSFREEFLKKFKSFCQDLETLNPNDYEVVSEETTTDPRQALDSNLDDELDQLFEEIA